MRKLTAALLSVVLVSCSTAHSSIPTEGQELSHFVLVMREHSDGQVSYAWHRAEEFNLERYLVPSLPAGLDGRIVHAAARPRDCHAEYLKCIEECMSRPLPRGYGHITAGRRLGGKLEYCQGRCRQPYNDCEELQELKPHEFSAWDGAMDWLKRNRKSILVGSVIVIAGVTFVVVSAGAGLVVLAPAVLLATAGPGSAPYAVGGVR
ncbi:hypothetical protein [Hyalangium sp.]|uniref:hypothetical protein n=1 Tax=Hyalangium sp. TaxID=2028555 RepID=UPI002D33CA15|nr:hypothetical protein [Hyalangium sp.]HYI02711.1 hypothetical protein [Hyalangium sp.]